MKIRSVVRMLAIGIFALVFFGCAGEEGQERVTDVKTAGAPEQFLTEKVAMAERTEDVRTFQGESLWEYINGDAEMYHPYGFVDVATGDYQFEDVAFIIDVYRFEDAVGAYGLYTAVRPTDPKLMVLGVQGFRTPSMVTAVKGKYLARLIAFNEMPETEAMLAAVADSLVASLPGTIERPAALEQFPDSNQMTAGDRYYAMSFIGYGFLTEVYEQGYVVEGDTVQLFLMSDPGGEKFVQWQGAVEAEAEHAQLDGELPYYEGRMLIAEGYEGTIVAGLKGSYLAGMRNYAPRHKEFLAAWLETLGQ